MTDENEYLEKPKNPGADDGKCANFDTCGNDGLDEDDCRCFGCGYLICEECSGDAPWGKHYVIDHWSETEE